MKKTYKLFCRLYQGVFRIALPFLPYRKPRLLKTIGDIAGLLNSKKVNSVLIVTDKVLAESESMAVLKEKIRQKNIQYVIYDETCANPTVGNVEAAKEQYIKGKCNAIIGFGGGSSIDCAKAVGALAVYPKKHIGQLQGLLKVRRRLPLLIAVPTTAGTGSEVTVTAVITDREKKHKYTMNNFTMIPHFAVLDPKVTFTLPPHHTSTTGMDALTHAVEAYIGNSTTRETRKLSLEVVKLVFENIETAYNEPRNKRARANMLLAAYKAGLAFTKSYVGYVHAVAHSLGGQYNVPHGLANSVLLPVVLKEYGECVYKKLYELGLAAEVCDRQDTYKEGAEKFITEIEKLNERLNIPKTIDVIIKADIPQMAKHAAKEANPLYPVPKLMNAKELECFYHKIADRSTK